MADIIQLVEKGKLLFLKTHASAIEGLTEVIENNKTIKDAIKLIGGKQDKIEDTGWIKMQTAGVVQQRSLEIRRIGKRVTLRGSGALQATADQVFYVIPPEIGGPLNDSRFELPVETSATNVKCLVYLRSDRNLRIQFNNAGSNVVSFDSVSYLID